MKSNRSKKKNDNNRKKIATPSEKKNKRNPLQQPHVKITT
jgi:hypothetical protein